MSATGSEFRPAKGATAKACSAYFALGVVAVAGSFHVGVTAAPGGWLEYFVAGFGWILGGLLLVGCLAGRRGVLVGAYLVGVLSGWAWVMAAFVLGGPIDDYPSRLEFDSAASRVNDQEEGERPDRQHMIHDLLDRGLFMGWGAAGVGRLLCTPAAGRPCPDVAVTCALGPDRGFGIDSELFVVLFVVRFGRDATVIETLPRTD